MTSIKNPDWMRMAAYAMCGMVVACMIAAGPSSTAWAQAVQKAKPPTGAKLAAKRHRPPSQDIECAAFTIHGVVPAAGDGVQEAGLYKASFGRLDLQARIHGGQAVDYWLTLDSHMLPPLRQLPPKSLRPCLDVKGTALRLSEQHQACTGTRFQILLTRAGENAEQYILLYRLAGSRPTARSWHFCRGTVLAAPASSAPPPAAP